MDNLFLYSHTGASPVNLASFLRIDDGYDVGEGGLHDPLLSQGALVAGRGYGVRANLREWTMPLRVASDGAWGDNRQIESVIRANLARGAYLDFQPGNVATNNRLRFTVEAGILEMQHRPRIQDVGRSESVLRLWTQPYGYMPTNISLTLGPGVGSPYNMGGVLTLLNPPASVLGDGVIPFRIAPNLAYGPTVASYGGQARNFTRMFWSLHSQPSVPSVFWSGYIATSQAYSPIGPATAPLPSFAPYPVTGTSLQFYVSGSGYATVPGTAVSPTTMIKTAVYPLASTAGVACWYVGRYRVFAFARALGASSPGWLVGAAFNDSVHPMPTYRIGQYATVAAPGGALFANAPSSWNVVDLGEMSYPPDGTPTSSIANSPPVINVWGRPLASVASWGAVPSWGPSQGMEFAGLALVPLASNGAYGMLSHPQGEGSGFDGLGLSAVAIDGWNRTISDYNLSRPLSPYYVGDLPQFDRRNAVGSGVALSMLTYSYSPSSKTMGVNHGMYYTQSLTVQYRPTFAFLRGL